LYANQCIDNHFDFDAFDERGCPAEG